MALSAIPSGPARFLIVGLEGLGHVVVDDKTHVGFVDAHAKGNGGDNDIDILHQELVLSARTLCRIHARMVRRRLYSIDLQGVGDFFHLLSAQAIDDAAAPLVFQGVLHDLAQGVFFWPHFIKQVGPVEARLVYVGTEDAEVLLDVVLHLGGGGGGQGNGGELANAVNDLPQTPVLGAKVMSPFRNAVGLVDGKKAEPDRTEEIGVLLFVERFRSHIEQLGLTRGHGFLYLDHLVLAQRAVEEMGDVVVIRVSADGVHLVLHQSDQRADHDGGAFLNQGGELVAQRLAAAGGHDDKNIPPLHHAGYDGFLVSFELIKPEKPRKSLLRRGPDQCVGMQ